MDKINNILSFSDFEKNWKAEKAAKTQGLQEKRELKTFTEMTDRELLLEILNILKIYVKPRLSGDKWPLGLG